MPDTRSLEGRAALISGGGRGIGRAIALRLAREGADVAINYRADEEAAQSAVAEAKTAGVRAVALKGSVHAFEDCRAMMDGALAALGRLDILINNAGIASRGKTIADTDPSEIERVMAVHAFGPFYLSQLAAPHLRAAPRSDVIFISSVATSYDAANGAPYSMGKAAMESLARTFAKEERRHGVRVNIVAPSLTVTDMGERLAKATRKVADIHELDQASPFGRVSTPDDIASLVAFLVSPQNEYISGQRVAVDGGMGG